MSTESGNGRLAALVFGGALLAAVFAWWMSLAPRPLPLDAPAEAFSAHRAITHIEQTALEPHPGGSHANEEVADYIVAQLKAMNVEMAYERPIMRMGRNSVERNAAILARVPGTSSTGGFAVDAHYDSTPYGPGAADDLSGVAAMLETIRALQAGPPLMNDVLFCFADKEETRGPGGPQVFIDHPWFEDVRVVLGLETRGTSGPALMFETGEENGFLIRQMAKAGVHPRATSIMFDFYDRMPFGSDFTRYKRLGIPGYNIAYIDDFCYYHTKLDTPENVSLASLQHHGCYTLGLARHLGNIPLENCKAPNAAYFNTIGSHMVVYPLSWGGPLAVAVLLLVAAIFAYGFLKKRISILGTLGSFGVCLASIVLSVLATTPFAYLTYYQFREHALYRNNSFSLAMVLIGLGIFVLMARLVRNRIRPQDLLAGVVLLCATVLVVFQIYLPGGSYAVTWPLLFLSLAFMALLRGSEDESPSEQRITATALGALPGIVLLVPTIVIMSYALTALAVPILLPTVLLIAIFLLPQTTLIPAKRHAAIGLCLLVAGGLLYTATFATLTPSPTRPWQNSLSYAINFDTGEAWWISGDPKLDEWTRNFFDDNTPRVSIAEFLEKDDGFTYLQAPAPTSPFGKTVLSILEDRVEGNRRFLKLFVDSPRDAQRIDLKLLSDVRVYEAKALGIKVEASHRESRETRRRSWELSLDTIPFEGGEIELEVETGKPVEIRVREMSCKLPDLPEFTPRPDDMMTEPNRVLDRRRRLRSNHTFSIATFRF